MNSYLIDANVWLALTVDRHLHAEAARAWLRSVDASRDELLFCRSTQLTLFRLLVNPTIMGIDALKPTEVFAVYETLLHGGNVRLAGENDTLDFNYRAVLDALGRKVSPASIMDAYLVAFATTSNAIIVTMDRGLARLADSQGVRSFLIRARTV